MKLLLNMLEKAVDVIPEIVVKLVLFLIFALILYNL